MGLQLDGARAVVTAPAKTEAEADAQARLTQKLEESALAAFLVEGAVKSRHANFNARHHYVKWHQPRNASHLWSAVEQFRTILCLPQHDRPAHARSMGKFVDWFNKQNNSPTLPPIPPKTFRNYFTSGRHPIRMRAGRPPLVPREDQLAIADLLCEYDAQNHGKSRSFVARCALLKLSLPTFWPLSRNTWRMPLPLRRTILNTVYNMTPEQSANFFKHTLLHVQR